MTVASGKVKKIAHPYLLRQYHMNTNCAKEDILVDRFDRMLLESWSDDFTAFVKAVAAICGIRDNISVESAIQHIKKGYRRFIDPVILNSILKNTIQQPPPSNTSIKLYLFKSYEALKAKLTGAGKGTKINPDARQVLNQNDFCPDLNHDQEVSRIREFLLSGFKNT
jgi:hypothetical protein